MRVGMIGLGKLGLPVALAIENCGHEVRGYEINKQTKELIKNKQMVNREDFAPSLLEESNLQLVSLRALVDWADIIFASPQTPHESRFEGTERLSDERADFDYKHLKKVVKDVAALAEESKHRTTLVVISTCLPGTFNREIKPLMNDYVDYVYNPFFIAMGTVIMDFLNPEFVLLGVEEEELAYKLISFYATIHNKPCFVTDTTTAEGIKVFYNTFITMKTVFGNMIGEMSYKLGMNADAIHTALSLATDRIISNKYLKSGVGDGGGCHPRDNIALSHIAREIGMSHNIFDDLMKAREDHMGWLAREAMRIAKETHLPLILLGKSFKPETNIETGSPAILMANILSDYGFPFWHHEEMVILPQACYFIATQHDRYRDYPFPSGSVVIDPFRYIPPRLGVEYVRIGN